MIVEHDIAIRNMSHVKLSASVTMVYTPLVDSSDISEIPKCTVSLCTEKACPYAAHGYSRLAWQRNYRLVPGLFDGVGTGVYMHPSVYHFKVTGSHEGQGHVALKIFKLGQHSKGFRHLISLSFTPTAFQVRAQLYF